MLRSAVGLEVGLVENVLDQRFEEIDTLDRECEDESNELQG